MPRWISPVGKQWNTAGGPDSGISRWQQAAGLRLPAEYRDFMTRHDGGRPYPNMFRHRAMDDQGFPNPSEHFVDPLYEWSHVVEWSKELGNRLPPGVLAIGADPGLIEIVLSLRAEDHGAVYSWVRNWAVWGSEENRYLCPQAPSFAAFMASLFDDDERSGHDYWHTPLRDGLKRKLVP